MDEIKSKAEREGAIFVDPFDSSNNEVDLDNEVPSEQIESCMKLVERAYRELFNAPGRHTDNEYRLRLMKNDLFNKFQTRFPHIFDMLTRRDIITNPELLGQVYYQVKLFGQSQKGDITREAARRHGMSTCMNSMVKRAQNRASYEEADVNTTLYNKEAEESGGQDDDNAHGQ